MKQLDGADISWIVGWVVAGSAYLLACRLTGQWAGGGAGELPTPLAASS